MYPLDNLYDVEQCDQMFGVKNSHFFPKVAQKVDAVAIT